MKKVSLLLASLLFFPLLAQAGDRDVLVKVVLTPAGDFEITGLVNGKGKETKDKSGKSVYIAQNLTVSVGGMKTGLETRDKHLHKTFKKGTEDEVLVKKAVCNPADKSGKGIITINGKDDAFNFTCQKEGNSMTAKFKLNLSTFGIKASYMSVGVEDEVNVEAHVPLE